MNAPVNNINVNVTNNVRPSNSNSPRILKRAPTRVHDCIRPFVRVHGKSFIGKSYKDLKAAILKEMVNSGDSVVNGYIGELTDRQILNHLYKNGITHQGGVVVPFEGSAPAEDDEYNEQDKVEVPLLPMFIAEDGTRFEKEEDQWRHDLELKIAAKKKPRTFREVLTDRIDSATNVDRECIESVLEYLFANKHLYDNENIKAA